MLSRERRHTAIILLVAWHQSQRRRIKCYTEFTFMSPLFVEIQEGEPESGQRSAHGRRFNRLRRRVASHCGALCLAVSVPNRDVPRCLHLVNDFRIERFTRTHYFAQLGLVIDELLCDQATPHRWRSTKGGHPCP